MQLGSFLGPERLHIEYKEFRIDYQILKKIKGKIDLDDTTTLLRWCTKSLKTTLKKYIGKHVIAFANTDIEYGELNIGISDSGEILGIPINTDMEINSYSAIREMIMEYAKNILSIGTNIKLLDTILNKINIDIISVDTTTIDLGYNVETYMHEKDKEMQEYILAEKNYRTKHLEMLESLRYYKRPINEIINISEIRDDLIDYIKINGTNLSTEESTILQDRLNDPMPIEFKLGDIMKQKLDKTTMGYWITRFRDDRANLILASRPVRTYQFKPLNPYYLILRDFRPIITKFADENINIIVIKIKFPGKKVLPSNTQLIYSVDGNDRIIFRSHDNLGQPCCVF